MCRRYFITSRHLGSITNLSSVSCRHRFGVLMSQPLPMFELHFSMSLTGHFSSSNAFSTFRTNTVTIYSSGRTTIMPTGTDTSELLNFCPVNCKINSSNSSLMRDFLRRSILSQSSRYFSFPRVSSILVQYFVSLYDRL